jgi:hypothetical protein
MGLIVATPVLFCRTIAFAQARMLDLVNRLVG